MNNKLREALINIVHHFCANCPNNGPDGCELSEVEGRSEYRCNMLKQAREAISTPPRNCDLYKSEPEAYQAYLTAMKNATKKTYVYFEPWLFAEAKGSEVAK